MLPRNIGVEGRSVKTGQAVIPNVRQKYCCCVLLTELHPVRYPLGTGTRTFSDTEYITRTRFFRHVPG